MSDITSNNGVSFVQKVKKIDVDEETIKIAKRLYDSITDIVTKIIEERTEINNFKAWYIEKHNKDPNAWTKKVKEYKWLQNRTSGQEYQVVLFSELREELNEMFEKQFERHWNTYEDRLKEDIIKELQSSIPTIKTIVETKSIRKEIKHIEKKIKNNTMRYCKHMNRHYKPIIHVNKIHLHIVELIEDLLKKIKKEAIKGYN